MELECLISILRSNEDIIYPCLIVSFDSSIQKYKDFDEFEKLVVKGTLKMSIKRASLHFVTSQ